MAEGRRMRAEGDSFLLPTSYFLLLTSYFLLLTALPFTLRAEGTKRLRDEETGFQPQSGEIFVEAGFYSDLAPEL